MAATDATKFLNKTEYERSLGRISEEFDKVAYLGERISGTPVAQKKLSVSPRQSIIVGRCIPLHPRKGKKYYFKDGIIKVMVEKNAGSESVVAYYGAHNLVTPLRTQNCTSGYPIVTIVRGGNRPVLVEITEESPKGKATFNLATMTRVREITIDNSITESPFIEIVNGKVTVTESPRPCGISSHIYTVFNDTYGLSNKVRSLVFKKGSVVAHSRRHISWSTRRNTRRGKVDTWATAPNYATKRAWAIPKGYWQRIKLGDKEQIVTKAFRGECVVYSLRRGRVGYKPLYLNAKHYKSGVLHDLVTDEKWNSLKSRSGLSDYCDLAILQYRK